ncbi:MAG: HEAT repeat domain-containing protein [Planctomycetes bacterium]|nr:HEAT repeat domain-containing protein [Planctomycetota bacterium]
MNQKQVAALLIAGMILTASAATIAILWRDSCNLSERQIPADQPAQSGELDASTAKPKSTSKAPSLPDTEQDVPAESTGPPDPTGGIAQLVTELQSIDRQVAYNAATELGNMGPEAIAAIPALVELATFDEKGTYRVYPGLAAIEAIPRISAESAVAYLIRALQEPSKRYWAAHLLGGFGDVARPAVLPLVDALRAVTEAQTEDERSASAAAAAALATIRPHGLSTLIGEMGHDDSEVRKLAVWATPRGSDGKPVVEELGSRLSDPDRAVRRLAAIALADIGADASDALPFIEMAMQEERDGFVLSELRRALENIQKSSDP